MPRKRLRQAATDRICERLSFAIEYAGDQRHTRPPARARTVAGRRGKATETPLSHASNSIGAIVLLSRNRGKSSGCEAREANPTSQVVADLIPASLSHGRKLRA